LEAVGEMSVSGFQAQPRFQLSSSDTGYTFGARPLRGLIKSFNPFYSAIFGGGILSGLVLRIGWIELHVQVWEGRRTFHQFVLVSDVLLHLETKALRSEN